LTGGSDEMRLNDNRSEFADLLFDEDFGDMWVGFEE